MVDLLSGVVFFRDLSAEELELLGTIAESVPFQKGETVISEGEPVDSLYVIGRGSVHARRRSGKREILLGRMGAGNVFGEINLFDPDVATASVVAMGESTLIRFKYEALKTLFKANPALGYKVTASLMAETSRRLRTTNQRLANVLYWEVSP